MAEPRDPETAAVPATTDDAPRTDRRAFLWRAAGEVAAGAGRLIELSRVAQRSATAAAAAAAAAGSLRPIVEGTEAPALPATATAPAGAPNPAPTPTLSAEQESFLAEARSAVIAVSDLSGSPQLTASWFHWDGVVFRLPTGLLSAKAANIGRDQRVSLLVGDIGGGWVAIAGHAEMVSGPAAPVEARAILAKYRPDVDPETAWADLDQSAAGTVILVVSPSRFVWRVG
jgi:hypothetical protein